MATLPPDMTVDQKFDLVLSQLCRRFVYFQSLGAPNEGFHIATNEADVLDEEYPHATDHLLRHLVKLIKTPTEFFAFLEEVFYENDDADIILNYVLEHFLLPIHYEWGNDTHPVVMRVIIWLFEAIVDFTMDYSETRPIPVIDTHEWIGEVVPDMHQTLYELMNRAFNAPLDMTSYEQDCKVIYKAICDDPLVDIRFISGLNHVYEKDVMEDMLYDVVLADTSNVLLRVDISDGGNDILMWTFVHT